MQCEPICTATEASQGVNRNLQSNRDAHYTEFVVRVFKSASEHRALGDVLRIWHVAVEASGAYKPNNIARVNARLIGGMQSSRVSANPRGQDTSGIAVPNRLSNPCVNAIPDSRSTLRRRA